MEELTALLLLKNMNEIKRIIESICNTTIDDDNIPLKDFGVDSLSILDITLQIEDLLNITLDDSIISNDMTFNSLMHYIHGLQNLE